MYRFIHSITCHVFIKPLLVFMKLSQLLATTDQIDLTRHTDGRDVALSGTWKGHHFNPSEGNVTVRVSQILRTKRVAFHSFDLNMLFVVHMLGYLQPIWY